MRHFMGLVVAGGLLLGTAASSDAQFSVGNPLGGQGLYTGSGYGLGYGYPSYGLGYPVYGVGSSSYRGIMPGYGVGYAPLYGGGFSYSSGYRGFVGPRVGYGSGYAGRPYYRGYGFGGYRGYGGMFR